MATRTAEGYQIAQTAAQIESAIGSELNAFVASLTALDAVDPTNGRVVVVKDGGAWAWVEDDESVVDSYNVRASTVSGYENAGRWIKQVGVATVVAALTDVEDVNPALVAAVFVAVAGAGVWAWKAGDTSSASSTIIKSTVSPYGDGGASEGSWVRVAS